MFEKRETAQNTEMMNFFWYRPIAPFFLYFWGIIFLLNAGVNVAISLTGLAQLTAIEWFLVVLYAILSIVAFCVGNYHRRIIDTPRKIEKIIAYVGTYVMTMFIFSIIIFIGVHVGESLSETYYYSSEYYIHFNRVSTLLNVVSECLVYLTAIFITSQYGIGAAVAVGVANFILNLSADFLAYIDQGINGISVVYAVLSSLSVFIYVAIPYFFAKRGTRKLLIFLAISSFVSSVFLLPQKIMQLTAYSDLYTKALAAISIIIYVLRNFVERLLVSAAFFGICQLIKRRQRKTEQKMEELKNETTGYEKGWICSCGKTNPSYTSTCVCGKNKRELALREIQ